MLDKGFSPVLLAAHLGLLYLEEKIILEQAIHSIGENDLVTGAIFSMDYQGSIYSLKFLPLVQRSIVRSPMKNFRPLFDSVWIGLLAIACFFYHPAIAQADYPDFYPKAELIGSNPKAKIDIYGSPNTQQPPIGKAAVGDQVKVLEQATDNSGDRWDRVQILNKTQLEGWIAEESVSLQKAESEVAPANPYFQINQFYPGSKLPQNSQSPQSSQNSQNPQNSQNSKSSQNSQSSQHSQN